MTKQTKEEKPKRAAGPKFKQVIPEGFRIRRTENPMAQILRDAESKPPGEAESGLSNVSSLLNEQPAGCSMDSPLNVSSPSISDSPLNMDRPQRLNVLASLPPVKGHTPFPHRYVDHLCRLLTADEQAVYAQLYRLSWGWGKDTCFISNPRLSERSNVKLSTMRRAVAGLVSKGVIEKTGRTFGGGGTEQGIEYRVFTLDSLSNTDSPPTSDSLLNMAPNKERIYKETIQSNFSQCPDCFGTGFWYPEGTAKGVKRCSHARLKREQPG